MTSSSHHATQTRPLRLLCPASVYTPMAILVLDRAAGGHVVESVHEGFTADDVRPNTGFELDIPEPCPVTPPPSEDELATLRGEVPERMIETGTYRDCAETVLAARY